MKNNDRLIQIPDKHTLKTKTKQNKKISETVKFKETKIHRKHLSPLLDKALIPLDIKIMLFHYVFIFNLPNPTMIKPEENK